ncbi:co-chaperone GroES [Patescibacteria group bacterium]
MKIKPLFDNVLVEPLEGETTLPSGIVIPDSAKEKPQQGKIIAVGEGNKETEMKVKKNDIVMYKKWGGTEIKVEGKELLLVKQEDILAIVENK